MATYTLRAEGSGRRHRADCAAGCHPPEHVSGRERAILALLSERTMGQAAARCGVGERTFRRWLTEDSEFKAEALRA